MSRWLASCACAAQQPRGGLRVEQSTCPFFVLLAVPAAARSPAACSPAIARRHPLSGSDVGAVFLSGDDIDSRGRSRVPAPVAGAFPLGWHSCLCYPASHVCACSLLVPVLRGGLVGALHSLPRCRHAAQTGCCSPAGGVSPCLSACGCVRPVRRAPRFFCASWPLACLAFDVVPCGRLRTPVVASWSLPSGRCSGMGTVRCFLLAVHPRS